MKRLNPDDIRNGAVRIISQGFRNEPGTFLLAFVESRVKGEGVAVAINPFDYFQPCVGVNFILFDGGGLGLLGSVILLVGLSCICVSKTPAYIYRGGSFAMLVSLQVSTWAYRRRPV